MNEPKNRRIAVIGLGYVGLPLAVALSKHFCVVGYDIKKERVEKLLEGIDTTNEVSVDQLLSSTINISNDPECLTQCDFFIITVPTPTDEANVPDLGPVENATKLVSKYLKIGDIVVYESTVYPGVTEEKCVPILEDLSGLKHLTDFNVGYSPERINPGDKVKTLENVVKIISGDTESSLKVIESIYSSIISAGVYAAPNIRVAEAAKVVENTQRDVNIALINELSELFNRLDIDTHDVLKAAGSKYNFLNFYPGLVGGHCIGVDPYYLSYKAEIHGYMPNIIRSARQVNNAMPIFIAKQVIKNMLCNNLLDCESKTLILGVTFKENVPDIRNSKVFDLHDALVSYGLKVDLSDVYANSSEVEDEYGVKLTKEPEIHGYDCVILAVTHDLYVESGWELIKKFIKPNQTILVVDIKAVLPKSECPENIKLWRP